MTGEERKRYDDDVKFRNAFCEHGSQRRKCNTCELLCEQHDNAALRARIEVLEKVVEWACVRLGIVNDPAYSGYTHDLCNEVIAELRRRAKEG